MGQPSPFTSPSAPGAGSVAPRAQELDGCLVAFSPTAFTAAGTGDNLTGYQGAPPRDRITTSIFLLETPNGAPIIFGGTPDTDPNKPHTHRVAAPARFSGVWMSNSNIVAALAPGGQPLVGAMILGRIRRSEVGRKPWNLVAVDGTPDMDRAIQIWSALQLGSLTYNEPTPLNPQAAPNTVQYGAPQTFGNGYAPSPVAPQPTAWSVPPVPQPQGYGAPAAQIAGWTGQPPVAGVPVPPVPQPPMPPAKLPLTPALAGLGWTQPAWDGLTLEQQTQVVDATPGARV